MAQTNEDRSAFQVWFGRDDRALLERVAEHLSTPVAKATMSDVLREALREYAQAQGVGNGVAPAEEPAA